MKLEAPNGMNQADDLMNQAFIESYGANVIAGVFKWVLVGSGFGDDLHCRRKISCSTGLWEPRHLHRDWCKSPQPGCQHRDMRQTASTRDGQARFTGGQFSNYKDP